MFTKKHAESIARKLKADIHSKGAHDIAVVMYMGKRVVHFGIRRGSRTDLGHDHLPGSLHLSPHDTLELARCPLSQEEWIKRMRDKGLIVD